MSSLLFPGDETTAKVTTPLPHLLAAGALALLLTTAACDSSGPTEEPPPPCDVLSECRTLNGISQVLDGTFVAGGALATDTSLYFTLTSLTNRVNPFTGILDSSSVYPTEVYLLSKSLGTGSNPDTDSTWRIENISRSPQVMSGAHGGRPTLKSDSDGQFHILWGELKQFEPAYTQWTLDKIMYISGQPGNWRSPRVAYNLPARPPDLSANTFSSPLARGSNGEPHAVFKGSSNSLRGHVKTMKRQPGGTWSTPQAPLGENTIDPYLASTDDGTLLLSYLRLRTPHEDTPTGLFFVKSSDGGQSWSEPKKIMPLGVTDQNTFVKVSSPRVVEGNAGTYHILFKYDLGGNEPGGNDPFSDQVWHSYSTDAGQAWSQPQAINSSDRGDLLSLEVAVDASKQVHAVYYLTPRFISRTGNQLRHAVWNGQHWQQRPNISNRDIMHFVGIGPGLTSDPSGCLHLIYEEAIERNDNPAETETRLRYRQLGCS